MAAKKPGKDAKKSDKKRKMADAQAVQKKPGEKKSAAKKTKSGRKTKSESQPRAKGTANKKMDSQTAHTGFAPPEAMVSPSLGRGQRLYMGIVAGTDVNGGPTRGIGVGATDLCEIAPSGEVAVAGDTFDGCRCKDGRWTPSLALHVSSLAGKVQFDRSFGWGVLDRDGWHHLYKDGWAPGVGPPPDKCSQLPAGTVRVGNQDYLMVTRTRDLVPQDSRLVKIDPNQAGWPTVPDSLKPASYKDFNQTQISGCEVDGWVYIVADRFLPRESPVWLYRCRPGTFTNRDSWEAWGPVNGDLRHWDYAQQPAGRLCDDHFGELSLRHIDGMFVLSAFNATRYRIEVHVCDRVEQILNSSWPSHRCTVVVEGKDLPQIYGGYLVPGSTLERARILVSEWVTSCDYPYNVREYEVNLERP